MDISYNDLRNKEIVNLTDGSKMGHIVDVIFNSESGRLCGFIAPGVKKLFKKCDDIFIPLEKVRRIGDDVILIRLEVDKFSQNSNITKNSNKTKTEKCYLDNGKGDSSFIRYRKLENKKYK